MTFLVIFASESYLERAKIRIAEYYLMILFALFGMLIMVIFPRQNDNFQHVHMLIPTWFKHVYVVV